MRIGMGGWYFSVGSPPSSGVAAIALSLPETIVRNDRNAQPISKPICTLLPNAKKRRGSGKCARKKISKEARKEIKTTQCCEETRKDGEKNETNPDRIRATYHCRDADRCVLTRVGALDAIKETHASVAGRAARARVRIQR